MADAISSLPLTDIQMRANGIGEVRFGSPQLVNVAFYDKSVLNPAKSRAAGRPVHDLVPFVRIQHPGERDFSDTPIADKPGTPTQYPAQYAAYQQKKQPVPNGTPVDLLFVQNPEVAANLRGMGVYVVEQLAHLSSEAIGRIGMGAQEWVNKARKYLEAAQKGVEFHEMQRELEKRDTTISVLTNNINLLKAQVERLMSQVAGTAQPHILSVQRTAPIAQQAAMTMPAAQIATAEPSLFDQQESQPEVEMADVTVDQPGPGIASYGVVAPPLTITDEDYEQPEAPAVKRGRGRPPGSKNKPKSRR